MIYRHYRQRLSKKTPIAYLFFVVIVWAAINWSNQQVDDGGYNSSAELNHFIEATVLQHFGESQSTQLTKSINRFYLIDAEAELFLACENAQENGWLMTDSLYQWALACIAFNKPEKARELIKHIQPNENPRTRLIHAYLTKNTIPDAPDNPTSADWITLFIHSQTANGGAAQNELNRRGKKLYRKGSFANLFYLAISILSLLACGFYFFNRKKYRWPRQSPVIDLWKSRSVLIWFFGGLIYATFLASMVGSSFADKPALAMVISFGIYVGVPALGLTLRFCPGIRSMDHLFRIRCKDLFGQLLQIITLAFVGIALTFTADYLLHFIQISSGDYDVRDFIDQANSSGGLMGLCSLITLAILAPFFEEILYRGYLFTAYKGEIGVPRAAIFSSLIFAAHHWYSLIGLISVLISGLIFCWQAHRSASLWPGIITHSLVNTCYFVSLNGWYSLN